MQRPEIGPGREQRVGPAGLFHGEVRRDRGDAFELRAEPGDAVEVQFGQPLGRNGPAADPAGQTAHRREADILCFIREGNRFGLVDALIRLRDRHDETGQAWVEAGRWCKIMRQSAGTPLLRQRDLASQIVEHKSSFGLGVANTQQVFGCSDGLRRQYCIWNCHTGLRSASGISLLNS